MRHLLKRGVNFRLAEAVVRFVNGRFKEKGKYATSHPVSNLELLFLHYQVDSMVLTVNNGIDGVRSRN